MITATGLTKKYGDHTVLDDLHLTVEAGTVFGLLGPNGAGKTTTVRILSTLLPADTGTATVGGHDVATDPGGVRRLIGVTGQFAAVDALLTAEENLRLMADLHHLGRRESRARIAALLERFDLADAARKASAQLSGGMRRKLDLAMTLVGNPSVIFLDEPTTGLDPRSRRTMWDIIRGLVADHGVTIFLTTQYLEEADELAHRIAVLDHGRLVAEGTPAQLKRRIDGGHVELRFPDAATLRTATTHFAGVHPDPDTLTLRVPSDGSVAELRRLLDTLDAAGIEPTELAVHTPDLDDVFLALTGPTDHGAPR
ncbi:ATP-binding cassette domain-containing protein [Cryptosporangium sp. NPDC051539]|uniref:ATP-binding cassette domain-containing protein n=1 Tax=Cryptosporangium sp. NPDC051539 TaxID=3363962 RepID=UPI0037A144E6